MTWYEIVHGPGIHQGDIVRNCPIPTLPAIEFVQVEDEAAEEETPIDITIADVCVMTQTCDIENEKVEEVLLARVVLWAAAVDAEKAEQNSFVGSKRFRELLVQGNVPNLTLLHKHEEDPRLDWSVVDFHHLYVLPKPTVSNIADQAGARLRLLSPYREHLGQTGKTLVDLCQTEPPARLRQRPESVPRGVRRELGTWAQVKLTKRELQVVRAAADGMTDDQTGRSLFMSRHTVKTHWKRILARHQIPNKAALLGRLLDELAPGWTRRLDRT